MMTHRDFYCSVATLPYPVSFCCSLSVDSFAALSTSLVAHSVRPRAAPSVPTIVRSCAHHRCRVHRRRIARSVMRISRIHSSQMCVRDDSCGVHATKMETMGVDLSDSRGFHPFHRFAVCPPLSIHFSRSDVRWKDVSDTWLHRFCPRRSLHVCEAIRRVDRAGDVQSLHPIPASRQPGTRLRTHTAPARALWRVVGTVAGWSTLTGTARSVSRTPCGHAYGSPRISVCRSNTVTHSLLYVSLPHSDSRRYVHP
jgi:hypothetical protein